MIITINSLAYNSYKENLTDSTLYYNDTYKNILGDTFVLGTSKLVPHNTDLKRGYVSNLKCGSTGVFSVSPKINIKHDIARVSKETVVLGYEDMDEYPVDFRIIIKLKGITIKNELIQGNTDYAYILEYPKQFVDEIELEIYKWSKPNKVAKLMEFYLGEYVITNGTSYNSEPSNLIDDILTQKEKYAFLDNNFILGVSKVVPSLLDTSIGWRTNFFCNSGALFEVIPKIQVKKVKPYFSQNILVTGFRDSDEYPVDFKLVIKLKGQVILIENVVNNTDYEYVYKYSAQYADEIELEIYKWSKPNRTAKLLELNFADYISIIEGIETKSTLTEKYSAKYSESATIINDTSVLADTIREIFLDSELLMSSDSVEANVVKKLSVISNGEAYNSNRLQLTNRVAETSENYAFLDGNFILGTHKLIPSNDKSKEIGWRSKFISGADGVFITRPILTMVLEGPTSMRGVYIVGDILKDEYPVDFRFRVIKDKVVVYESLVTNNIYSDYTYEFQETVADEIELEIIKWNKPYKAAKLLEFYIPLWETVILVSSEAYNTNKYNLVDSIEYQDSNVNSLDGNFILGTHTLIDSTLTTQTGWRSANMSNAEGIFETPPTVRVKFDKTHKLQGAYIVGDILKDEYPVDFKCAVRRSGLLVANDTIIGNTQSRFVFEFLEDDVTEIEITIYKWNKPYKSAKLLEFYIPTYTTLTAKVAHNTYADMQYRAEYVGKAQVYFENTIETSAFITKVTSSEPLDNSSSISDIYNIRSRTINFDPILSETYIFAKASIIKSMNYATSITADKYRKKNNPVNSASVSNYITVNTRPFGVSEEKELYNTEIELDGDKDIIVNFDSNYVPVKEAIISITTYDEETSQDIIPLHTSIESAYVYPSVAFIKLINTSPEKIKIIISGTHLEVKSGEQAIAKDDNSIRENGKLSYILEENNLIQTREIADKIANLILASSKDPRREVAVDWRGNPAIEIGDEITVTDFERTDSFTTSFIVTKQEFIYDGALKSLITGRKKI